MKLRKEKMFAYFIFIFSVVLPMSLSVYAGILRDLTAGKLFVHIFTSGYIIVSSFLFIVYFLSFGRVSSKTNSSGESRKVSDLSIVLLYFISVIIMAFTFFKLFIYTGVPKEILIFSVSIVIGLVLFILMVLIVKKVAELSKNNNKEN